MAITTNDHTKGDLQKKQNHTSDDQVKAINHPTSDAPAESSKKTATQKNV